LVHPAGAGFNNYRYRYGMDSFVQALTYIRQVRSLDH